MRLAIELSPNTDLTWNSNDQYKLRGRLWTALDGTKYQKLHDNSETPTFNFSNIFSTSEENSINKVIKENENCLLFISSPHPGLLDTIAANLNSEPKLNIGDNSFAIQNVQSRDIDVGRVGTTGNIKTSTGAYIRLPSEVREEYNINTPYSKDSLLSWTPDMPLNAFKQRIIDNTSWKVNSLCPTVQETPTQFQELFDSVEILTTYQADVPVKEDYIHSFFPVVCEFEYTVKSEIHRKWLNTIIDSGIGWRNSLGFGFTNIVNSEI